MPLNTGLSWESVSKRYKYQTAHIWMGSGVEPFNENKGGRNNYAKLRSFFSLSLIATSGLIVSVIPIL